VTPVHCGIDGNEKADTVSRKKVNNPITEIRTYSSFIDIYIGILAPIVPIHGNPNGGIHQITK